MPAVGGGGFGEDGFRVDDVLREMSLWKRFAASIRNVGGSGPVESRVAPAVWAEHYDSGEWDDPPGKLALPYDLERVAQLLRDGTEPFHPDRDRLAFARYLIDLGCQPPPDDPKAPAGHGR